MRRRLAVLAVAAALISGVWSPAASAAPNNNNAKKLLEAVTAAGVMQHEQALQQIADANGGTRASGTPGYEASVDYVVGQLTAAGYSPQLQEFEFPFFEELSPAVLEQVEPGGASYETASFTFSGSGDVIAPATMVDVQIPPAPVPSSTSGCEPEDFDGFPDGNVAVIQRGTCTFAVKATNAEAAGASAVVIFNEGQPGRTDVVLGTLGGPVVTIPVVGASFATGEELNGVPGLVLHVSTDTISEARTTWNVIAETAERQRRQRGGRRCPPRQRRRRSGDQRQRQRLVHHPRGGPPDGEGQAPQHGPFHLVRGRGAGPARLHPLREPARRRADRRHRPQPELRHGRLAQLRALRLRR